ncbi:MAG: hypothetical protein M3O32_03690, partial [Actinomycetota bacterium]|nr:hypothetical protein [Actinomycetota bacterium]
MSTYQPEPLRRPVVDKVLPDPAPPDRETNRYAITAFVWALGFGGVPILGPAIAFRYANKSRAAIAHRPDIMKGGQLEGAARSIATFALVVQLLALAIVLALLAIGGLDVFSTGAASAPSVAPTKVLADCGRPQT